jgi:NAD(P)-dependent dehydrogenase (short-subunit alcohol dehydrogenase family)
MVAQLADRPDTVVFAGARDPSHANSLLALRAQHPETVHIVKLVSADRRDAEEAVAIVKETVGHLDVVIANAGLMNSYVSSAEVSVEAMREHFEVYPSY